jgi:hypothetical protein
LKRALSTTTGIAATALLAGTLLGGGTTALARPQSQTAAQEEPVASVPDWQNLPYLRASTAWFRILSNHEKFGGIEVSASTPLTANKPDPTSEEYNGIDLEALWASTCSAVDEQTFKKSRKVYLPGHPAKLQISDWAYVSTGKNPIKSITVKVNGETVHHVIGDDVRTLANRNVVTLSRGARSSFKYGLNTFTLVAVKRHTDKSARYCEYKKFGAAFELAGTFRADVTSNIPHGTATDHAAFMPMKITNNGPSHLPAGTYPCQVPASGGTTPGSCGYPSISFWAVSDTADVTGVVALDGGSVDSPARQDCQTYPTSAGPRTGYSLNCSLPALAPGESVTIGIGLTYDGVTPTSIIYFGYGAPGYGETTTTNESNGEQDRQVTANQT